MMKTYCNRHKRLLQSRIYKEVTSHIASSALVFGGPNLCEYSYFVAKHVCKNKHNKIHTYEIDPEVLMEQIRECRVMPAKLFDKLVIHADNIYKAKAQRFIDLDFKRTIKKEKDIITSLFQKQKKIKRGKKVFMFTVCLRQSSIQEIQDFLSELFNAQLKIENCDTRYNKKVIHTLRKYTVNVYTYKDGAPMLSCVISYD